MAAGGPADRAGCRAFGVRTRQRARTGERDGSFSQPFGVTRRPAERSDGAGKGAAIFYRHLGATPAPPSGLEPAYGSAAVAINPLPRAACRLRRVPSVP